MESSRSLHIPPRLLIDQVSDHVGSDTVVELETAGA
jgi:hypothetical protein